MLDVKEGRDIIITAIAMANPPPVRYGLLLKKGESYDLAETSDVGSNCSVRSCIKFSEGTAFQAEKWLCKYTLCIGGAPSFSYVIHFKEK